MTHHFGITLHYPQAIVYCSCAWMRVISWRNIDPLADEARYQWTMHVIGEQNEEFAAREGALRQRLGMVEAQP